MINITLLDGLVKSYSEPISILKLAQDISTSLAKSTIAGKVDGKIVACEYVIQQDAIVEIITTKSNDAFKIINTTTALLTANSLQSLFEQVQIAQIYITDEEFHVDFLSNVAVKEADIDQISNHITKIVNENLPIKSENVSAQAVKVNFKNNEFVQQLYQENNQLYSYWINESQQNFISDNIACNYSKFAKHFKLLNLSGAYWQNDAKNVMLQRISGVAQATLEQLNQWLEVLNERKERDHRKIGKDLDIFTFDQLVGQGLPIWLANGTVIKKEIQKYIRDKEWEYDFVEVETPDMATVEMYHVSGHWDHYHENMFAPMKMGNESLVLRPMSCPHHIAVYNHRKRSYRDFPIRLAEHAKLYRYEASGALTGLERVRKMELTDSHIFVRKDQIKSEFKYCFKLIEEVLNDFNIKIDYFSLSLRDKHDKEKYFNDDAMWNYAESMLREALDELKLDYVEMEGEAAFYGPKLDVQIKTVLGHEITVATLQFDFLLPEKFDITYIDEKGEKARPTMIHRGLIGTYERFISVLLEQTKGILPLWLSPKQITLIPVANNNQTHLQYVEKVYQLLKVNKYRCTIDDSEQRLNYKIRASQISKVPYQLVLGDNEVDNNTITYRCYGSEEQTTVTVNEFLTILSGRVKNKV